MEEKYPLSRFDELPDALYLAVGKLNVRYGHFEHHIGLTFKRYNDNLSWSEAFQQERELNRKEGTKKAQKDYARKEKDKDKEGQLRALFGRAGGLAGQRDIVVHAHWFIDPETHELAGQYKGKRIPYTPETITKLADDLLGVVGQINNLTSRTEDNPDGMIYESSAASFRTPTKTPPWFSQT